MILTVEMNTADLTALRGRLRAEPRESEWLEFKTNRYEPQASGTNSRMQEITGEHSKDITGALQALVRDGLLTQQNQRR